MKIVNIDFENLHIFWTNWGISMKFFRKDVTCDMKNHKKSKLQGWVKLNAPAFLGLWFHD